MDELRDASPHHGFSAARRHMSMALLCAVGTFNLIDRQVITILLEPIRREFGASDTMMGLMTGSAFAVLYGVASIPLARLADKYPRRLVIGVCLSLWSLLTAAGGLAGNIFQLAATRLGVAVGESGSGPATYSIMADLYGRHSRARAFAAYAASTSLGIGLAVIVGGWLNDLLGWRLTLILMGTPGLILALLVLFAFREPQRGIADPVAWTDNETTDSLSNTCRYLWGIRSFRYAVLVAGFGAATGYGLLFWGPTFLIRVHHLTPATAGLYFGGTSIVALVTGQIFSGILMDYAARRDLRAYMWLAAAGCTIAIPFGILFTLASDWRFAILGFGLLSFFFSSHNMGSIVIGLTLVPPRMRATATMIVSLAALLCGSGLAPFIIGGVNDLLSAREGDLAIRYSLTLAVGFLSLAVVSAMASARWLRADFKRLTEINEGNAEAK